jgi:LacI family transcriptional regulator
MSEKRQVILSLRTSVPHHRKIAMGVASYSHQQGNWKIHVVHDPLENFPDLLFDPLDNTPDFRRWRADGIIAFCINRKAASLVHKLKIPKVGIEAEHSCLNLNWKIPYFCTDNEAIGRLGARELIQRGLKRLAFCGIPSSRFTGWSEQRQLSFAHCAQEAGIYCSVFPGKSPHSVNPSTLRKQLLAWLKSLDKPVGLMASHDTRARHVLTACWELGLMVPEDVAVIGVDNDELMCELTSPPLSSIEQGSRQIGYQAAALLDRLMAGQEAEQLKYVIPPEGVVTRRSSDALAIEDADVADALAYIRDHACDPILVDDVVDAVGISRSTLESRFRTITGRTIHYEILRAQIERARYLIATTDLPLKQIAVQSGFTHVNYLTTVFREQTGWTPAKYRKHAKS